jgi:membrane protein
VNWFLFTLIYKTLPRARVLWSEAIEGAAVAAVMWEINRQVLAALVIGERYSAYGIVGSMIVLLLWVYMASSILFLGAEYIQVVRRPSTPSK